MSRPLHLFGFLCLGIVSAAIIGTAGVISYWIADRRLPAEVLSTEVLTPEVRPGGRLVLKQVIRYDRDCGVNVDRTIWSEHSQRDFLEPIKYETPPIGLGEFPIISAEVVPDYFDEGEGSYIATPNYFCNPVQRYIWAITRKPNVVKFRIKR